MSRTADRDRVLVLLDDTEGLSNLKVKNELNLADERYRRIRDQLIEEKASRKIRMSRRWNSPDPPRRERFPVPNRVPIPR